MSDKYLFEKEGTDPDIEGFEQLLSVYRIEPIVPSFSRANEQSVKRPTLFRIMFVYAVPVAAVAMLTVGLVFMGGYFNLVRRDPSATAFMKTASPDLNVDPFATTLPVRTDDENTGTRFRVQNIATRRPARGVKTRRINYRKDAEPAQSTTARLTPEEKYAYEQVLVALWITGSKLKVVPDTINRVNDRSSNEKR